MAYFNLLTPEEVELFHFYGKKAQSPSMWSSDDFATGFLLVSKLTGTNRVDSGCGSCRNTLLADLRSLYDQFLRS